VTEIPAARQQVAAGSVLSTEPLVVACNGGAVRMDYGQTEDSVSMDGVRVGRELQLTAGMQFGPHCGAGVPPAC